MERSPVADGTDLEGVVGLVRRAPSSHHRDRIVDFVEREPGCLRRETREGHLTASAVVTNRERSKVALILHRKLGRWLQPGGHADGDPDLAAVAYREVVEETGLVGCRLAQAAPIDCDVHEIPASAGVPAHLHYDVRFLVETSEPLSLRPDPREVVQAAWFDCEAVLDPTFPTDESVRRLVRCLAQAQTS